MEQNSGNILQHKINYCSSLSVEQSVRSGGQSRRMSYKYAVLLLLRYPQVDELFADSLQFCDLCSFMGRRELQC